MEPPTKQHKSREEHDDIVTAVDIVNEFDRLKEEAEYVASCDWGDQQFVL